MKKNSAKKRLLLIGTAIVSVTMFIGTPKAYAACVVGASPNYNCSGATVVAQSIFLDDANVTTSAGFSLNNPAGDGLFIRGNGYLQYTDNNGSSLTAGGGDALRIQVLGNVIAGNAGQIGVTIGTGATLLGQSDGIDLQNAGGGALALSVGGNVTGTTGNGISISSTGGGALDIDIASGVIVTGETRGVTINNNGAVPGTFDLHGTIATTGLFNDAFVLGNLSSNMDVNLDAGSRIIGNTTDNNASTNYSHFTAVDDFTTEGNFNVSTFAISSGKTLSISRGNYVSMNTMPASAGGILDFEIENTGSFGSLSVLNGAVTLTGMTVQASVAGTGLANGDMFLVGDGALGSAIVGGPSGTRTAISDNSALWSFNMVDGTDAAVATYATNNLFLTTDDTDLWLIASAVASNFSAQNTATGSTVGTALDAIANGAPTTGGLGTIVSGTTIGTDTIFTFMPSPNIIPNVIGVIGTQTNNIVTGNSLDVLNDLGGYKDLSIITPPQHGTVILDQGDAEMNENTKPSNHSTNMPTSNLSTLFNDKNGDTSSSLRSGTGESNGNKLGASPRAPIRPSSSTDSLSIGSADNDDSLRGNQDNIRLREIIHGNGDALKGYSTWGQFFGQRIHQGERGGQPGYQGTIGGVVVGANTEKFFDRTTTGVAFTYARGFIEGGGLSGAETGLDSYGLTFTAQRKLGGGAYLGGLASYTLSQFDTARHNIGGLGGPTAYGNYYGNSYGAQVQAGKVFNMGGTFVVPNLTVSAGRLDSQSYTETGAGGASLHNNSSSLDSAALSASVQVQRSWKDSEGNVATPALQLGYSYDLLGEAVDTDSSFIGGGPAFNSQGVDPARNTFNLGLTMKYETSGNVDFDAAYNLQTKQDYVAHGASVRATVHF